MADRHNQVNDTAVDRALREALDVSPSPDFVARIRTRIASEPAPRSAWHRWAVWAPVTAGATAVIAFGLWVARPAEVRLRPDTTTATNVSPTPTVRLKPDTTPGTVRLKQDTTYDHQTNEGRTYVVSAFRRTVKEPEILISPSESAALRRLIARASQEAVVVIPVALPEPTLGEEIKPLPEIEPIKVDPITPVDGEGDRQ